VALVWWRLSQNYGIDRDTYLVHRDQLLGEPDLFEDTPVINGLFLTVLTGYYAGALYLVRVPSVTVESDLRVGTVAQYIFCFHA